MRSFHRLRLPPLIAAALSRFCSSVRNRWACRPRAQHVICFDGDAAAKGEGCLPCGTLAACGIFRF
jgi:hypothetical protein